MTGKVSRPPATRDPRALFNRARFLLGALSPKQFPSDGGAEVAFAGRSNAGKSSALNRLCDRRGLARTGKQPGRTREINFFALDPEAANRLVDLPGYGFARVPLEQRRRWEQLIGRYLATRKSLRGMVLIMDIRHPLRESDWMLLDWIRDRALPLHCVLTKADKLSHGAAQRAVQAVRQAVAERGAGVQAFSATQGTGVEALRERVADWLHAGPTAGCGTNEAAAGRRAKKSPAR